MRVKLLRIVNPILFILMLIQAISGLGQRYAGQDFFILLRRIHLPNGILLVIFFIIHLYLNWGWVKMNFLKPRFKK
ncbi:hypothetical protein AMJ74_02205 [candidate division WOR_3 bacterium SM1_77]|uniref:Flavinylation-associated cytochrome domain-containing protein n=1 Tax=candidate division WOR_3 bacterium SM1_77 TaxID=1703778 RepID=A0A0S8K1K7_UNCW3|nr:MAG: hypothetical protein AMJ74_02205 [candidate division WOR_3 bacterium SM1_77]